MGKLYLSIFIISFWLVFPIISGMLMLSTETGISINDLENYFSFAETLKPTDIKSSGNTGIELAGETIVYIGETILYIIVSFFTFIALYISLLFLTISNIPIYLRIFVWILQLTSFLIMVFIIRGTD